MIKALLHSKVVKKTYEVSPILDGGISYTTERVGQASKIGFNILKNGEINFHEGDLFQSFIDNKPFCSGIVFAKSKKQDVITTTAWDLLRYLKYKQSYLIQKMTLSQVVKLIAEEFSLPLGEVENTKYVMPKKLYEDKSLMDIITDCIQITAVATKKIYVLFDNFGKLSLKEINNMKSQFVLGSESFVTDYTYDTSIEESYNYIKLVRPNKKTGRGDTYIAHDSKKVSQWGRLQYYKKMDENMNPAKTKSMAKKYLEYYCKTGRKLKLNCIGIPEIRAGMMIPISIPDLGDISLNKVLLIDRCTHKIGASNHTMDLEMQVYNG